MYVVVIRVIYYHCTDSIPLFSVSRPVTKCGVGFRYLSMLVEYANYCGDPTVLHTALLFISITRIVSVA